MFAMLSELITGNKPLVMDQSFMAESPRAVASRNPDVPEDGVPKNLESDFFDVGNANRSEGDDDSICAWESDEDAGLQEQGDRPQGVRSESQPESRPEARSDDDYVDVQEFLSGAVRELDNEESILPASPENNGLDESQPLGMPVLNDSETSPNHPSHENGEMNANQQMRRDSIASSSAFCTTTAPDSPPRAEGEAIYPLKEEEYIIILFQNVDCFAFGSQQRIPPVVAKNVSSEAIYPLKEEEYRSVPCPAEDESQTENLPQGLVDQGTKGDISGPESREDRENVGCDQEAEHRANPVYEEEGAQEAHAEREARALEYLSSVSNIDEIDAKGNTILMLSIVKGMENMVRELLARGANANLPNFNGNTPLMAAVRYERVDIISDLIIAGADVNHRNTTGNTPSIWAAINGNAAIIQMLLEASADPTIANDEGLNAFDIALQNGHQDLFPSRNKLRNFFGKVYGALRAFE